jgi:uncharacterized protein
MSLPLQLDNSIKDAMRAKAADELNTLRMLKSAAKYAVIDERGANAALNDDDIIKAARREMKKRDDAITAFTQAGRPEAAARELAEKNILARYLPTALDPAALATLVREAVAEAGATSKKDMGAVMKIAMAKAAGRVDGKTLNAAVQLALPA